MIRPRQLRSPRTLAPVLATAFLLGWLVGPAPSRAAEDAAERGTTRPAPQEPSDRPAPSTAPAADAAREAPADAAPGDTTWYAVYLQGKKVGHMRATRRAEAGQVVTETAARFALGRGGVSMKISASDRAVETEDGQPLSFEARMNLGGMMEQVSRGTIRDGKLTLDVTAGGRKRTETREWPQGALLPEGFRLLTIRKGLAEGTTYSARVFDPASASMVDHDIRVGPREEVDLLGRVVRLTRIDMTMRMGGSQLLSTLYADQQSNTLKMALPLAGTQFEMIACTRDFALSPNDAVDFLNAAVIASPTAIQKPHEAKAITYRLTPKGETKLDLPQTSWQTVRHNDDGTTTVTVRRAAAPTEAAFPYRGENKELLESLQPTRYLQCDDERVKALVPQAVGAATDTASAVRNITRFVSEYITEQTLSVGYATAAEVAETRKGDCTEHAVLAAALCRAAGIPAQVVQGYAYTDHWAGKDAVFVGHAWFRAWVEDRWVDSDAALGLFTPGHITLSILPDGMGNLFELVQNIGQFTVTEVKVER